MKLARRFLGLLALALLVTSGSVFGAEDYYWKGSYGRGVGLIPPMECPAGKNLVGALCYDNCRSGYAVSGLQCVQAGGCPSGYSDRGLICHYNGEAMYSPVHWDSCHSRTAKVCAFGKCIGNYCVGATVEDGCRSGYSKTASMCYYTSVPSGMSGTALDPMKGSYALANPVALVQVCRDGRAMQDGLCYTPCRSGYNGIGPVCWANTPPGYVDCGAGYAKNSTVCGLTTFGQVASVGGLALVLAPPTAIASAKANAARLYAKAGNSVNELLGAAPDVVKAVAKIGPDIMNVADDIAKTAAAGGDVVGKMSALTRITKGIFQGGDGIKLFGLFAKINKLGTNVTVESYFNVTSVSDSLRVSRDVATFMSLTLGVYSFVNPPIPGVDIAASLFDVLSNYMYSVYGQ